MLDSIHKEGYYITSCSYIDFLACFYVKKVIQKIIVFNRFVSFLFYLADNTTLHHYLAAG